MTGIEFRVAAYLFCGYVLVLFATFLMALRRGYSWRRLARQSAAIRPQIREALVDCLAGNHDLTRLKGFVRTNEADVGETLMGFQGTVGGSALDRLCEITLDLALAHAWCRQTHSKDVTVRRAAFQRLAFICRFEPCRRVAGELLEEALEDPDPEVRLAASRGLLQTGEVKDVERVFEQAVSRSLLVRVLLTEDLRRYAIPLSEGVIPKILEAEDQARILGTLNVLTAWERAVPLLGLAPLLIHHDREIRLKALALAPMVPFSVEIRNGVMEALSDDDLEIRVSAVRTAARLGLKESQPMLAHCLRNGPVQLARAAAAALASLPPSGWTILEELSASPNPMTAAEARAALELARKAGT
jgi:HEAT repeat protein